MNTAWVLLVSFVIGFIFLAIAMFLYCKTLKNNYENDNIVAIENEEKSINDGIKHIKIVCK